MTLKATKRAPTKPPKYKRKDGENELNDRRTFNLTLTNTLFTGLLVAVGIGGVFLARRTLRTIESQTKGIRDQVDFMIASERAWILVEIGNLPGFNPDPNKLEIFWIFPAIKNHGKTTARITRIRGIVKLIPEGQKLSPVPEYIVGQGFDQQANLVLHPQGAIQPRLGINGFEFIDVQQGKTTWYVYGSVDYLEFGGKPRNSAYCYFYVVQAGFSPHPSGLCPAFEAPIAYTECT